MQTDLVSVLILTYNSSDTLVETLDSVDSQTYSNIEIIISDDCSTDDTVSIAQDWIEKSGTVKTVKIVSTASNCGIAGNCNNALNASSGRYIKLLAGDDCLLPNAIEMFYEEIQKHDQDVVLQSKVIFMDGNGVDYSENDKIYTDVQGTYDLLQNTEINQYKRMLKANFLISPAVGLLKKDFFERFGTFDERFPMMEDYPFYTKLTAHGIKFRLLNVSLVRYRIRENSLSRSGGGARYRKSFKDYFFKVRLKTMLKHGMLISALKQFIKILFGKY